MTSTARGRRSSGRVAGATRRLCRRTDGLGQFDEPPDLEARSFIEDRQSVTPAGHRQTGSEEFGDRSVRDALLARIPPPGEHRTATCPDGVDGRLDEGRLADPGLTLDDHDPPIRGRHPRGVQDRGEIAVPAHEAGTHGQPARGGHDNGTRRPCDVRPDLGISIDPVFADRLVELGRLVQRRDAKFAIEQGHKRAVLADRAGTIAGPCEQVHHPPLTRLIERVELDPAPGGLDRPGWIAVEAARRGQPVEQVPDEAFDVGRSRRLPVVEVRAVAQCESGEERASRQCRGRLQVRQPVRGGETLEFDQVDVRDGRLHRDAGPLDAESLAADRRSERGQGPPQRAAGRFVVRVGPEHRR